MTSQIAASAEAGDEAATAFLGLDVPGLDDVDYDVDTVILSWSEICPTTGHALEPVRLRRLDEATVDLVVRIDEPLRGGGDEATRPYHVIAVPIVPLDEVVLVIR